MSAANVKTSENYLMKTSDVFGPMKHLATNYQILINKIF